MPPAPQFKATDIESFDATLVNPMCKGYQGVTVAAYGGVTKIIYTPYGSNQQPHGWLLAYDPNAQGGFKNKASYATTDLRQTVDGSAQGFLGGFVGDPPWYYLPPYMKNTGAGTTDNGLFVRWKFTESIKTGTYQKFDIQGMANPPGAVGWATGAYDGSRYVYFVPVSRFSTKKPHGWIVRYDTLGDFTHPSAWATFDLQASFGQKATGFQSNALIGDWLYLVPYGMGYSLLLRLNITKDFSQPGSYQKVDLANFNQEARGYTGAVVNGDYLYLVPWRDLTKPLVKQSQSVIARYDTAGQFDPIPSTNTSWQFFDLAGVNALAKGYQGGATNGPFMYFTPTANFAIDAPPPFLRWDCSKPLTAGWKSLASTGAPPMTLMEAYGGYAYMSPYGIEGDSGLIHRIKMH